MLYRICKGIGICQDEKIRISGKKRFRKVPLFNDK
jgi:hypothetical protein